MEAAIKADTQEQEIGIEVKEFKAPANAADFNGQTEFRHTYENGNNVIFLLLSDGRVCVVREGLGEDVEKATMEANGDKSKWMPALTASCIKINGRGINMFELLKMKAKDYTNIQAAVTELNF